MKNNANNEQLQFITFPNTGIQICRNFPVRRNIDINPEKLWNIAKSKAEELESDEIKELISEHIAVNKKLEATKWFRTDINELVFFRMTRVSDQYHLDIVIDTHNGAGTQIKNKISCVIEKGVIPFRKKFVVGNVFVEEYKNFERGSLLIDFGNSGTSALFSPSGAGPLRERLIAMNSPLDPYYKTRDPSESNIVKSGITVLKVPQGNEKEPWVVMGKRAEELIQQEPYATYLFAPKKYIRYWPERQANLEPHTQYVGVRGQRDGLYPMLMYVRMTMDHILSNILGTLANPNFNNMAPEMYPRLNRIMVTYPLTWRKSDKDLYKKIVKDAAEKLLAWDEELKERFDVELICSEPVAVAAYVIWETLFQFGVGAIDLVGSTLGKKDAGSPLRLLVVDIGGGSTDIALVEITWEPRMDDRSVDVKFKLLESMRFNRAGDRISHIIVTSLYEFFKEKYGISESLDFKAESDNVAFNRTFKQTVVSKMSELAEEAKMEISQSGNWTLSEEDEIFLVEKGFDPILDTNSADVGSAQRLSISQQVLENWLRQDKQSIRTKGEPGFMDIFFYLGELKSSLEKRGKRPDLAVLSGRTTRFPFIRDLIVQHLDMPYHRVKTIKELLPLTIEKEGHENPDKISVVCGAQRFWFGDNVRFIPLPDEPIFNRYIGTVMETPEGLKINKVYIEPGDTHPYTLELEVFSTSVLRIGHAFRRDGLAEVIAELTNPSQESVKVRVDIEDDFTVSLKDKNIGIFLDEWIPGGNSLIVDNFNDTGRIDCEPQGFIASIVNSNNP